MRIRLLLSKLMRIKRRLIKLTLIKLTLIEPMLIKLIYIILWYYHSSNPYAFSHCHPLFLFSPSSSLSHLGERDTAGGEDRNSGSGHVEGGSIRVQEGESLGVHPFLQHQARYGLGGHDP